MKVDHINHWQNRPGMIARPDVITQVIREARLLGGLPHIGGGLPDAFPIVVIDLGEDEETARLAEPDPTMKERK